MGIADRDYQRQHRYGGSGFLSQLTPVVKALLILNVAVFLLDLLIEHQTGEKVFRKFGAFSVESAIYNFEIWRFVTFPFIHGSLGPVLFNSLGLFFFGPWLERWWGATKFVVFYLLCGVAGALFFTLLVIVGMVPAGGAYSLLVGASAGIYGILIGVATIAPNLRVSLIFPPIELTMRQMALGLLAISGISLVLKLGGGGAGEAGHLGGAILGFFLMRHPWLLGKPDLKEMFRPKPAPPRREAKLKPRVNPNLTRDSEVDVILDKVSREGLHSLTNSEREFLLKASNKK